MMTKYAKIQNIEIKSLFEKTIVNEGVKFVLKKLAIPEKSACYHVCIQDAQ